MVPSTKKSMKNVSIIAGGSRGDIQPYIGLGVALQEAGYRVRVLTNDNNTPFVQNFNLVPVAIFPDIYSRLRFDPILLKSMSDGDVTAFCEGIQLLNEETAPDVCSSFLNEMMQHTPDLLVIGTMSQYFGEYASRFMRIPLLNIALQTIAMDPLRAPWGIPTLPDGQHLDAVRGIVTNMVEGWRHYDDAMIKQGKRPLLHEYDAKVLALNLFEKPPHEKFICQSPLFRNILYPTSHDRLTFVGASVIDAKQQDSNKDFFGGNEEHDNVEKFLQRATRDEVKVVYCGWGSMICKSPHHMVLMAISALRISGFRGIVLGGWAELSMTKLREATDDSSLIQFAEENVLFVKEASHENLFPRVACTVHHGGAGTTNAALRAGVPTVVTPVFLDQYDNAYLVSKLGVGVGFATKQLQSLTSEELGEAIKLCVSSQSLNEEARSFGAKIRAEGGTHRIVNKIEQYWKEHIQTGVFWDIVDGTPTKENDARTSPETVVYSQ